MSVKQFVKFTCDYCKTVETHEIDTATGQLDPQKVKHWSSAKMNQIVDGKEQGVTLNFDSLKCHAQSVKKISEGKAVILKGAPPPKPEEPPNKVREKIRFDDEGHATEEQGQQAAPSVEQPEPPSEDKSASEPPEPVSTQAGR